jgi:hypothetical protein
LSDASHTGGLPADELQFDQVEYAASAPAAACKACGQPLRDLYYDINGQPVCPSCREQVQRALESGSRLGRFALATLYGSLAGVVGAAIYYGVRQLTNIEFGLISIVVGLMVGGAVKKGSGGRGGWFYQGLAMFLTYTAIVATYIPPAIEAFRQQADKDAAAAKAQQPVKPAGAAALPGEAVAAEEPGEPAAVPRPSLAEVLLAIVVLTGLAYALPVFVGFQSPMILIIVGIGLYEAWVMNRRAAVAINGPYRIGPASGGSAVDVEPTG